MTSFTDVAIADRVHQRSIGLGEQHAREVTSLYIIVGLVAAFNNSWQCSFPCVPLFVLWASETLVDRLFTVVLDHYNPSQNVLFYSLFFGM